MVKTLAFDSQQDPGWAYSALEGSQGADCADHVDALPPFVHDGDELFPTHRYPILDRVLLQNNETGGYTTAPDMMTPNSTYRYAVTRNKIKNQLTPTKTPEKQKSPSSFINVENNQPNFVMENNSSVNVQVTTVAPRSTQQTVVIIPPPRERSCRKVEPDVPPVKIYSARTGMQSVRCQQAQLFKRPPPSGRNNNNNKTARQQGTKQGRPPISVTITPRRVTSKGEPGLEKVATFGERTLSSYIDDDDKKLLRLARTPTPPPQENLKTVIIIDNTNHRTNNNRANGLRKLPEAGVLRTKEPVPASQLFVGFFTLDEEAQTDKPSVFTVRSKLVSEIQNRAQNLASATTVCEPVANRTAAVQQPQQEPSRAKTVLEPLTDTTVDGKKLPTGPLSLNQHLPESAENEEKHVPVAAVDAGGVIPAATATFCALCNEEKELVIKNTKNKADIIKKALDSTKDFRNWNLNRITISAKDKVVASRATPVLKESELALQRMAYHRYRFPVKMQKAISFEDFMRMRLLRMAIKERRVREAPLSSDQDLLPNVDIPPVACPHHHHHQHQHQHNSYINIVNNFDSIVNVVPSTNTSTLTSNLSSRPPSPVTNQPSNNVSRDASAQYHLLCNMCRQLKYFK